MNKIKKLLLLCGTCILGLSLFSCAQPTQEAIKYTVSYDVNGHGEAVRSIEVDANTVLTTEQLAPLTSGEDYSFVGWFDADTKAVGGEYKVTKNVTLKAKWEAVVYTITYKNCDGMSNLNPVKYSVESDTIVLKDVSKPNYKFNGWFTNSSLLEGKITQINKGSTGNITLYASFVEAIPPENVSEVIVSYNNKTISLSWTNPSDADFKGVNVYVDGVQKNTVQDKNSVDITNLENGKVYNVILKAFDNNNNESEGVSKTCSLYTLTENPKVVGTKEINGKSFDIMIFGDYPQTVMKDGITLSEEITTVNEMDCKFGNDGRYYAHFKAELLGFYENQTQTGYKFANDTNIVDGADYYFAVEPIKWRVLKNNEDGSKLLLSEIGIETDRSFSTQDYYNVSELRNYIIGEGKYKDKGIINKAFTPYALEQIKETTITETPYETTDEGVEMYTINDKLFLLDREDFLNEEYGFTSVDDPGKGNTISERQFTVSDYAMAFAPICNNYIGDFLCRRNYSESTSNRDVIRGDGAVVWDGNMYRKGILPALTLK